MSLSGGGQSPLDGFGPVLVLAGVILLAAFVATFLCSGWFDAWLARRGRGAR